MSGILTGRKWTAATIRRSESTQSGFQRMSEAVLITEGELEQARQDPHTARDFSRGVAREVLAGLSGPAEVHVVAVLRLGKAARPLANPP